MLGVCVGGGPERKHSGDEGERTRQKVAGVGGAGRQGMRQPRGNFVQPVPNFRRPGGLGRESQAEAPASPAAQSAQLQRGGAARSAG